MTRYRLELASPGDGTVETWHYDPVVSHLENAAGEAVFHPTFPRHPGSFRAARAVSPDNPGVKRAVTTLKIQMGFRCNYACAYCNQASWNGFLGGAVEDAHMFLRNLDGWFRPAEGDDVRIEFWGGEPFVYWAKLKVLGEELRRRFPRARFNVITNGSLLDDEKADWLIAHRFGVQISHDGPAQKYRNPEDILDDPDKRRVIRKLVEASNLPADGAGEGGPRFALGFGTVLTRWNVSLAAARRHIEDRLGVPPGSISHNTEEILLPYDEDALACLPQDAAEHRRALHVLFREAANGETVAGCNSVRAKLEDFFHSLGTRRPLLALGQKCGMDREDAIAVNLMGEVTTCHNVSAADPRHNLGNVRDLEAVRLTSAHHHQTRDECRACPLVQMCKGSCMFLECDLWRAACDVSFTYNLALFAAALFYLSGRTLTRIAAPEGGFIRRQGSAAVEAIRLADAHA